MAMACGTHEVLQIKTLLGDIGIIAKIPKGLHYDNQTTINISENQILHESTKYVEDDCRFITGKVPANVICPIMIYQVRK